MTSSPTMIAERAGTASEAPTNLGDWYAIQVKRYEEHRVVRHLAPKQIPTFLPLIEASSRRKEAGGSARLDPLFPGYLFVQMEGLHIESTQWHVVRWTPGVRRILGTEETPVPMPTGVIEAIQARTSELGFVRPGVRFTPGERVTIRSGPLAGLEAIFEQPTSKNGRVRVLLELLGQLGRAEIDELDLE